MDGQIAFLGECIVDDPLPLDKVVPHLFGSKGFLPHLEFGNTCQFSNAVQQSFGGGNTTIEVNDYIICLERKILVADISVAKEVDFAGDIVEIVGICRSILDGSIQAVRGHEDFRIAGDRRRLVYDGIFEKTVYQPFEQRFIDQRILSMAWRDHDT